MANDDEHATKESPKKGDIKRTVSRSTSKATDDETGRKREYFKAELERLRVSLKEDQSKIKTPPLHEHTPDTFNGLDPYFSTYTAEHIIDAPNEVRHDHSSRPMALGLIDPWDDYKMDKQVLSSIDNGHGEGDGVKTRKPKSKKGNGAKEGSTHLPKFPAVNIKTSDLTTKTLYYSDVPSLREALRKKYSTNTDAKIEEDYTRTKQDFHRMDLDRMDEYHPISRPHMRATYFAYLQNNPGSRKAVYDCIRQITQKDAEKQKKAGQKQNSGFKAKSAEQPVA